MSNSKANELLQELVENLNNCWAGKARFTSDEAYKLVKKIAKEIEEDKSDTNEIN